MAGNVPRMRSRWLWSSRSNADFKSASRTHNLLLCSPQRTVWMIRIASWHPRPGRNPYWRWSIRASHSGSSALRTRFCWARSAITGIPSGRFPPFLGMYTRRTGSACQCMDWRCRRIASSALAWEVNATFPSMPAVRRPELRSLTCRTLTSVLARLRSINLCRLRTCFRSPACAALKILCRSRRTCSFCVRQSTASQSSRSSGPFAATSGAREPTTSIAVVVVSIVLAPNLSVGFRLSVGMDSSKGHPAHVSSLSGPDTGLVCGQLYGAAIWKDQPSAPLSCRLSACHHSLLGRPVPARGSAFLAVGLPAGGQSCRTVTGLPRFTRMSPGRCRVFSIPRGRGALMADENTSATTAVSQRQALDSSCTSHLRSWELTGLHRDFTCIHPFRPSPCL